MMKTLLLLFLSITLSQAADSPIPNRLIDYPGFQKLVLETGPVREAHRLTEDEFLEAMADPQTVILDARSASMYALRHIRGAINLPFTEFTAENFPVQVHAHFDLL